MSVATNRSTVVLAFDSETRAEEALYALRQLDAARLVRLSDAALIVRDAHGDVSIRDTHDLSPQAKQAIISVSALAGFLLGTLWRGIRAGLIGAFVVGQTCAILITVVDPGYSDLYLEQLARDVSPGTSMLVASVDFKSEGMDAVIQSRLAGARILPPAVIPSTGQMLLESARGA